MTVRTSKRPEKPPRYVPTLTEVVTEEWVVAEAVPDGDSGEVQAQKAGTVMLAPEKPAVSAVQADGTPVGLTTADWPVSPLVLPSNSRQCMQEERGAEPEVLAEALQTVREASPAQNADSGAMPAEPIGAHGHWLPNALEEAVAQRVMQRVDLGLDQRLRDAIATVVQEQTRSLLPRLREEVESVVRQVVHEAVADEVTKGSVRKPH